MEKEERPSSNMNRKKIAVEAAGVAVGLVVLGAKYRSWHVSRRRIVEAQETHLRGARFDNAALLNEPDVLIYKKAAVLKVAAALVISEVPLNNKTLRDVTGLSKNDEIAGRLLLESKGLVHVIERHLTEDGSPHYYPSDLLHEAANDQEIFPALAAYINLQLEQQESEQRTNDS